MAYRTRFETRGWVSLAGAQQGLFGDAPPRVERDDRIPLDVVLEGILHLVVTRVDEPTGETHVEARLQNGQLITNGTPVPSAAALDVPLRLLHHPDGRLEALGEPLPGVAGHAVRALVLGLQVSLPDEPRATWTADEAMDDGTYHVGYRVLGGGADDAPWVLGKRWYTHTRADADGTLLARRIVRSEGTIRLPADGPWFTALTSTLHLEERAAEVRCAAYRTTIDAQQLVPPPTLPPLSATTTSQQGTGEANAADISPADAPPPSAEVFVLRFLDLCDTSYVSARAYLLGLLQRHAGTARALAHYLDERGPDLKPDDELMLWRLLAQGGTPSCQEALCAVFESSEFHARSMDLALRHIDVVPDVGEALRASLWSLFDSEAGAGDTRAEDTRMIAVLALGALGHRDLASASTADALADGLFSRLEQADETRDQMLLLSAIANQGHDGSVEKLESYTHDRNERIGLAAIAAYRRMSSPAATDSLIRLYEGTRDLERRTAALGSLATMPRGERVVTWAHETLQRETEAPLQVGLIRLLHDAVPQDEALQATLRALLERKPPAAVRKSIYEALRAR